MKTLAICLALITTLSVATPSQSQAADPQFGHMVFFTLKDNTPDNREKLVVGCKEFLANHEGVVHFSTGVRDDEQQRDVNDTEFDVALHVVFRNKEAHDRYQTHPRHLKFIEEYGDMWSGVRVFDSSLAGMKFQPERLRAVNATDRPAKRIALPDAAAEFSGMIRGKIIEKGDGRLVVQVQKVTKVWRNSGAKDAEALIGKPVIVAASDFLPVRRFVDKLPVGETIEVDVVHKGGEVLTLQELTQEQRKWVGVD